MNIELIAFDLDGTLMNDVKQIPDENIRALEYAAGKGVLVVPATGRVFPGVPDVLKELPFIRYYITANGAMVYDAEEDTVIHRADITLELALRIMAYADTIPVIYDCYKDNCGYMTRSMYDCLEEYISIPEMLPYIQELRTPVDSLPGMIRRRGESIQKMQLYVKDHSIKDGLIKALQERFPEAAISTSLPFNIEVNSAYADKGIALRALCSYLGIPRERCMAFGDGTNDTALLSAAGLGVAMANGAEDVKRIADFVTGSNNSAGVAKAIYRFI